VDWILAARLDTTPASLDAFIIIAASDPVLFGKTGSRGKRRKSGELADLVNGSRDRCECPVQAIFEMMSTKLSTETVDKFVNV
jgi:hypothetical protein